MPTGHADCAVSDETMNPMLKVLAATGRAVVFAVSGVAALLILQAYLARWRRRPELVPHVQVRSGLFGDEATGKPLELAILGDSLAAGFGANDSDDTVGVLLAKGLVAASEQPVQLRNVAMVGAESKDLAAQIAHLEHPDVKLEVVVIIVGGNDVLRFQRIGASVQYLASAVRDLRRRGCHVVVATCPDMGTVRLFAQPLRLLAHLLSRLLATAQTIVVLRAGGRTVSLADTLGPSFKRQPADMFSADHIHPSSEGYARAAEVLLPSVCAAAGYWGGWKLSLPHRIYWREQRMPWLVWLAFWAARHAGAEVTTVQQHRGKLVHLEWPHKGLPHDVDLPHRNWRSGGHHRGAIDKRIGRTPGP